MLHFFVFSILLIINTIHTQDKILRKKFLKAVLTFANRMLLLDEWKIIPDVLNV